MASSSISVENEGQIVHVVGEAAARCDLHFFQGRCAGGKRAFSVLQKAIYLLDRHSKNAMTRASKQCAGRDLVFSVYKTC